MNLERTKLLEQFVKDDPSDPFPLYALALEWVKNDPSKAGKLFESLLLIHPDYLPIYYQAGHHLITQGAFARAKTVLEIGILKTRTAGDQKALAELRSLYDDLD